MAPAGGAVDDGNSGPAGSSARALSHRRSCSQAHSSIPAFPPAPALAAAHEQRPAAPVEVVLGERERFLDARAGAPEHDDRRT
jgi:hypothetical protein